MTRRNLMLTFATVLIIGLGASAECAERVWLDPAHLTLTDIGSTGTMTVRIEGAAEIAGVEFYITYNPKVVKVVSTPKPGGCPTPDIKIYNDFDNEKGLVRYAAACLNRMTCDTVENPNQDTLTIEFERVGTGDADIRFSLSKDDKGISIVAGNGIEIFDHRTPTNWQHAKVSQSAKVENKASDR